jgi:hypothetical protein
LTANGCVFPRAVKSKKWPGSATVEVAHIWVRQGTWTGPFMLDEQVTTGITPFLAPPDTIAGHPHRLKANEGKSFQGSNILGLGFTMEPEDAKRLIAKNSRNKDVLFPYLNGEDLNSRFDLSPSRWVINFLDWPLNRETAPEGYTGPVAADYPDCLAIVEEKVKPERAENNDRRRREIWWQFTRPTIDLYTAISELKRVIVRARVSDTHAFAMCGSSQVFSEQLVVTALPSPGHFAVLQSEIHHWWYRPLASSLRTDVRYSPTDVLEPFPWPDTISPLADLGVSYHESRSRIMQSHQEGLTRVYRRFHDLNEASSDIHNLRQLHAEMDHAVAAAYGWTDLDLGHSFHQTKQGLRYTISEAARREVLGRLLKLNHERYAEEVAKGLHEKKKGTKAGPRKKSATISEAAGASLFNEDE